MKIEYSTNGGTDWTEIIASTANDGIHPWTVNATVSSNCKVKISEASDGDPFDESDNVFTIDDSTSIGENPQNILTLMEDFAAIPNPASKDQNVTFYFTPDANIESVKLKIYDPVGNLVFEDCKDKLYGLRIGENYNLAEWNLRNNSGRVVACGSYLAVLMIKSKDGRMDVLRTIVGVKDNH